MNLSSKLRALVEDNYPLEELKGRSDEVLIDYFSYWPNLEASSNLEAIRTWIHSWVDEINRQPKEVDHSWRMEQAMQAGMMGGITAYNDALGCSIDDSDDECWSCGGGGCDRCY